MKASVNRTVKTLSAAVVAAGLVIAPAAVAVEGAPAEEGTTATGEEVAPADSTSTEGPAAAESEGSTTEEPEGSTTEEPEGSTTEEPEGSTTEEPEGSTTEEPEGTSTEEPEGTSTEEPEGTSTEEPEETTAKPEVELDADATSEYNDVLSDEAVIQSIHRKGCLITLKVAVNKAGSYKVEIWDDGESLAVPTVAGEAGSVQTLTYMMGANVGQRADGYDFRLMTSSGAKVQLVDWDFADSGSVMQQCAAAAAAQTANGTQLAKTGSNAGLLSLVALGFVGLGAASIYGRRVLA